MRYDQHYQQRVAQPTETKPPNSNGGEGFSLNHSQQSARNGVRARRLNVALVSDFYLPFVGGVEIHIKELATLLSKHDRIGNVVVVTHKYEDHNHRYTGVKQYDGFRVYYLNIHYNRQHMISYPTFMFNFGKAVRILRQEKIDIVHCHQTGSTLALEFIFYARVLGLKVLLTEHSLYGFRSLPDIHFNRVCQFFVPLCDRVIAVSKTTRNNLILRSGVNLHQVVVIPNGVSDVSHIKAKRLQRMSSCLDRNIRVISVGRMTYRRGTDLLIEILPLLCQRHQDIEVLIVGDGVKRKALQKVVQIQGLQKRVKVLGIISDHQKLLQTMAECDIFLNTPLTESFGIALAEAAMLGLYCVSTNVGGVEEAIPKSSLFPCKVEPQNLLNVLSGVIQKVREQQGGSGDCTEDFAYPWAAVGERTIQLYDCVAKEVGKSKGFYLVKCLKSGNFFQFFFCILACILYLVQLLPCLN